MAEIAGERQRRQHRQHSQDESTHDDESYGW
jgi:hypothetical protein